MAGRGPAPKEDPIRRNAPTVPTTQVTSDGALRGPELPDDIQWHPRTVAWYNGWRASPQATVMVESDWEAMLEAAVLHTQFWRGVTSGGMKSTEMTNLSAELRRRMAQFGATYEDRLRLRMSISSDHTEKTEEEEIQAAAAAAVDYAQRLAQAAADKKGD